MFATYTWSHAIDDAPEQNNIDSPNFLLSDPTNRRRDRGNSLTDRRHAFNGNLLYTPVLQGGSRVFRYLVNGNRIAVIATIQSGDVFNMGSNRVLNGDPSTASTFQRPLFIGRNTLRAPRTSEFDVRYTRLFPIRERMKLRIHRGVDQHLQSHERSRTEQHRNRGCGGQHRHLAVVGLDSGSRSAPSAARVQV
jgi:hypothetical protein